MAFQAAVTSGTMARGRKLVPPAERKLGSLIPSFACQSPFKRLTPPKRRNRFRDTSSVQSDLSQVAALIHSLTQYLILTRYSPTRIGNIPLHVSGPRTFDMQDASQTMVRSVALGGRKASDIGRGVFDGKYYDGNLHRMRRQSERPRPASIPHVRPSSLVCSTRTCPSARVRLRCAALHVAFRLEPEPRPHPHPHPTEGYDTYRRSSRFSNTAVKCLP